MISKLSTLTLLILAFSNLGNSQECQLLNQNGNFEAVTTFIGSEPANGISTNIVDNWEASHGTVDYFTPNWNWYGLQGLYSNAGHLCYGNRESHDHSEGMFTKVNVSADEDLIYTLSFDASSVCDASENGFLNVALNNNLSADGHNWFQYPTSESLPHFFTENQQLDRIELTDEYKFQDGFLHHYDLSFIPEASFSQLWFFSEYQHEYTEFVNCGVVIDNVELTAMTTSLASIDYEKMEDESYLFKGKFTNELTVENYDWRLNDVSVSDSSEFKKDLIEGVHEICLDIIDSRGACGSVCISVEVNGEIEETGETSIDVSENYGGCIYKVCLESPGLPYLNSFSFLNPQGVLVTLDEYSYGFSFPYCAGGNEALCTEQGDELHLFLEDLNKYFIINNYKATAQFDVYSFPLESFCKGRIISMTSDELAAEQVVMADYYSDDLATFPLEFAFDPTVCKQSTGVVDGNSVSTELSSENDGDEGLLAAKNRNITVFEADYNTDSETVEINYLAGNEILQGGIYSIDGKKLIDLKNFLGYDSVDLSNFVPGAYILRVTSRSENQTEIFYKS